MRLLDFLEQDKDKIKKDITAAKSVEEVENVLSSALERLLYLHNESCSDPQLQLAASHLIHTARSGLAFLDTAPESSPIEEYAARKGHSGLRRRTMIMLFAGAACIILMLMLAFAGTWENLNIMSALQALLLAGAGSLLLFFAGRSASVDASGSRQKPGRGYESSRASNGKTSNGIFNNSKSFADSGKAWRALRQVTAAMDQSLMSLESQLPAWNANYIDEDWNGGQVNSENSSRANGQNGGRNSSRSKAGTNGQGKSSAHTNGNALESALQNLVDAELAASLLEASYSRDGAIALEKLEDFKYAMFRRGLTVADFDADHAAYFDVIPGAANETIRPAILKDGTVLKRGLAAGGM